MAGEIKLPVIGSIKKSWAITGAIITAGIVGYAAIRHARNVSLGGGTAPAAVDSTGTSADTGITATDDNLDPETGFDFGTAADQEALAQLETGSGEFGGDSGFGGFDDLLPGATTSTTAAANSGPGTFTDNAHWIAWCEDNVQGYSPQQIQGALSAAEARIKVTPTQLAIYQACLAVGGPPPAGIPTPAVKSTGSHGGSGTATKTVDVPKVTGKSYTAAAAELHGKKLVAHRAEPDVGTVTTQDPAAGEKVHEGAVVVLSGRGAKPK